MKAHGMVALRWAAFTVAAHACMGGAAATAEPHAPVARAAAQEDDSAPTGIDAARAALDEAERERNAGDLERARAAIARVLPALGPPANDAPPAAAPDPLRDALFDATFACAWALGEPAVARDAMQRALVERERVLPGHHPGVQAARFNLAVALSALRDFAGARVLQETCLAHYERTRPEGDPDLQLARLNLASSVGNLGDFERARELQELAIAGYGRGPAGHDHDLQLARLALAATLGRLGDTRAARSLHETILADFERTLPADHPDLQRARWNLAASLDATGDPWSARRLREQAIAALSLHLPEDHPNLLSWRRQLAVTLFAVGDLHGARALFEQVIAIQSRTLPDDHPDLLKSLEGLGYTIHQLGDLAGARALAERVLEITSRTLPEDHPRLQAARMNLANTLALLGDHATACKLEEQVLEAYGRTRASHRNLLVARSNHAVTLQEMGRLDEALRLHEQVLEEMARDVPENHPDRLQAALNVADVLLEGRDQERAREMLDRLLPIVERDVSLDHPLAERAQRVLIGVLALEGEADSARFRDAARAFTRSVELQARAALLCGASREAAERMAQLEPEVGIALSLADGLAGEPQDAELLQRAFVAVECGRNPELLVAKVARAADASPGHAAARAEAAAARAEVARIAQGELDAGALDAAVRRVETAERALRALAEEQGAAALALDADAIAAALAGDEAAVAFRRYWRLRVDGKEVRAQDEMCAFVLRRGQPLARVELGPAAEIEGAAIAWRDAMLVSVERSMAPDATVPPEETERGRGIALRALVLDPLRDAIGDATRLTLVADDILHCVPLDALPLDEDARLGGRFDVAQRLTLVECTWRDETTGGEPRLVVLGSPSFNRPPRDAAAPAAEGAAQPPVAGAAASGERRGSWQKTFEPLVFTGVEAQGIAALFEEVFADDAAEPGERARVLLRDEASRDAVAALAPDARFLHLATHGWFAPDSVRSLADRDGPDIIDASLGLARQSAADRVIGASPMVLCGLALAGANLPPDGYGRQPGLITAEEIAGFDLGRCELAVLSACDTSVGIRRSGQGVASLQKALHVAGARAVVTSLWKVRDEATKELMLDFYRRLWVEKEPQRRALWEAKMRLRDAKDEFGRPAYATRDWAAWVLTGE